MGGWIAIEKMYSGPGINKWGVKYYFYWAKYLPGDKGKVLARVFTNA